MHCVCSLLLGNPNLEDPYLVAQVVKVIRRLLGWVGPQQTTNICKTVGKWHEMHCLTTTTCVCMHACVHACVQMCTHEM